MKIIIFLAYNIYFLIPITRFPKNVNELSDLTNDARLEAESEYSFSGLRGSLALSLVVRAQDGVSENVQFVQVDTIDRKYSVTHQCRYHYL